MCHNAPELSVFIFNHFDWCTRLFFSGFRKKSCQPLTSDTLNIFLMRVSHSNNRFEWKRFTCPCFPTRTNMRPLERHYNGSQPFGWLRNAKHTETIQNIEPKSIHLLALTFGSMRGLSFEAATSHRWSACSQCSQCFFSVIVVVRRQYVRMRVPKISKYRNIDMFSNCCSTFHWPSRSGIISNDPFFRCCFFYFRFFSHALAAFWPTPCRVK